MIISSTDINKHMPNWKWEESEKNQERKISNRIALILKTYYFYILPETMNIIIRRQIISKCIVESSSTIPKAMIKQYFKVDGHC